MLLFLLRGFMCFLTDWGGAARGKKNGLVLKKERMKNRHFPTLPLNWTTRAPTRPPPP